MFETFPSGGSIHASAKLEGIDGRAPQDCVEHVAECDSTRGILPGPDTLRIDRRKEPWLCKFASPFMIV